MRLLQNKLAFAAAAILYGTLVVSGQALHFLPGMDHFSDSAEHCACCHHHGSPGPESSEDCLAENSECPICQFLALAKDRVVYAPLDCWNPHVASLRNDSVLTDIAAHFDLYSARGPPLQV